jgi:predicted DNA binding CopG/RHH family protein
MKKSKLPKIDSIQKLAEFWDSHGLTDFEGELEEVGEPVFARGGAIKVPLASRDIKAVKELAHAKGVSAAQLVRAWVLERIAHRNNNQRPKR